MTDRIFALTVVLEKDLRTDDVQPLVDAIAMMRWVLRVDKHVSDLTNYAAYARARSELKTKLWRALETDSE